MRTKAKDKAPGGNGISRSAMYRSGVDSPTQHIEALIDAYGTQHVIDMVHRITYDMIKFGDSIYNREYNATLNALPYPTLRKRGASRAEQKTLREMIAAKMKAG